jgi:hypothetical protein
MASKHSTRCEDMGADAAWKCAESLLHQLQERAEEGTDSAEEKLDQLDDHALTALQAAFREGNLTQSVF